MDPYQMILQKSIADMIFAQSTFEIDHAKLVEMKCYQAIKEIQEILEDASLDDVACSWKIEKIVCCLEDLGLSCGTRHDFG